MRYTDHVVPDQPRPLPDGPLYFVGIGGAGMSAIAQVLAERGRRIAGADPGISLAVRERLERVGVHIYTNHDARQLEDAAVVVVSDAIPAANPEVQAAKERGLPIFRRPEVLGAIVNAGRGIAIAGTHGKTTTTGMVASILIHAGLDPTVLIGGDLPLIGGNARSGKGDIVVAESCEAYDGFLYLHPEIAIVLNIEADHLDYHGTAEHVFESFERFAGQIKDKGSLIVCADDAKAANLIRGKSADARILRGVGGILYGFGPSAFVRAVNVQMNSERPEFDIAWGDERILGRVRLQVPGRHNILNALAAVCACFQMGVSPQYYVSGLESFTGTGRRFERIGEARGVLIVDDYAHHPTEIKATLAAARSAYPNRRLVAVFQPHLYSRTRDLMDEFAEALSAADVVYLTDIYKAREEPIPGVSSEVLAARIQERKPGLSVAYVPDKNDLPAALAGGVREGDLVLTMGAGDIRKAGDGLLRALTAG